jgi:hypothetical protein
MRGLNRRRKQQPDAVFRAGRPSETALLDYARAKQDLQIDVAIHLAAYPVSDGVDQLRSVLRRIDMDAKRAFAERRVDHPDDHPRLLFTSVNRTVPSRAVQTPSSQAEEIGTWHAISTVHPGTRCGNGKFTP